MSNDQKVTSNEQKVTSNEQILTSNEQILTSNKQKVTSNEQKVQPQNTQNLRNFQEIPNENRKTVKYGIETCEIELHFFEQTFTMNVNWKLPCIILNEK